jgi:hypothetical protein
MSETADKSLGLPEGYDAGACDPEVPVGLISIRAVRFFVAPQTRASNSIQS